MDDLWTIKRFCRWRYDLPDDAEPTKAQENTVSQMCRDGTLPAKKVFGQWRVDTSEILRRVKHG